MTIVYLSLGSNLGNRADNLKQAITLLQEKSNITVEAVSPIYETQPVGGVVQDDFYNVVARVDTSLNASALLVVLQDIEKTLKRVRIQHWGPRTIDLDILLFGNETWSTDNLTIPHREMANRLFVLTPLLDVVLPERKHEVQQLISATTDKNWIRQVSNQ
ncbi:2-amino-4-hydroxy-6-hydroxymethyldihydropteridine diphosphokinase [Leuconostoc litchii]|uniref:2-amino-4-hydroxy-6-hydroxymethyldihydropteridine diphosphokinase n=1 Tax=Leuconostoc litchii TaxID=1981069 RepID=A0A652NE09_9LACO|nr:2-amino-4-hydroxy-6-hydroxymethyldihydropteridine diphosphokinase [Leuconostoc litchii]TYC46510.1 2-amino-4-hydroxy-6-hydroxymethyldihydropteridine diphosphokinase [Leuconostoc litchii]GMA70174.1 2-amino-4-hydroxy-6-hydroxymethyldihydropteridine diphosphokinase [Leuconostoc litchii]